MASLPPNGTARLFIDYITGPAGSGVEHTVMFRVAASSGGGTVAQTDVLDLLQGMGAGAFKDGWRVLRARFAQQGSDFSFPVTLIPGLAAFLGTNAAAFSRDREAVEWTWQGRSPTTGRRVDFSLYGIHFPLPIGFRINVGAGSPAFVNNTVPYLNSGANEFFAIDNLKPVWYEYVNANYNSYWERRIRSGV